MNFFDYLEEKFLDLGFKSKNKKLWYRESFDGYIVCEFQRFRYDTEGSGFLNFGIVYPTLAEKKIRVPKGESTWHLRGRFKAIIEKPNMDDMFPIEIADSDLLEQIEASITNKILPFLVNYSDISNLINDLSSANFNYARALTSINAELAEKVISSRQ